MISRKSFLQVMSTGVVGALLPSNIFGRASGSRFGPNPVQKENLLPGTNAWMLTNPSQLGEIQGYSGQASVNAGEVLDLYVSTTAPSFTAEIYRLGYYQGRGGNLKATLPNQPGVSQGFWIYGMAPPNYLGAITSYRVANDETNIVDANWTKSLSVTIPSRWTSGIYLVLLTESATGTQWHVPFVVRSDNTSTDLLFKVPFNTNQAYNVWGGVSAYNCFRPGHLGDRSTYHSFNRPYWQGWGTQNLLQWEYPMVRFMEEMGFDVAYTTNMAISSGLTNLAFAKGLVTAGHDEYVSQNERLAIEEAVRKGLDVAYFGANNLYWQVRDEADFNGNAHRVMVTYKVSMNHTNAVKHWDPISHNGPLGVPLTTDQWAASTVNYPESHLIKQRWLCVPKVWMSQDMSVTNTHHWAYAGSGLSDGAEIVGAIGGEVDAVDLKYLKPSQRATVLAKSKILGNDNANYVCHSVITEDAATNTMVFNAGTFFWPVVLSDFPSYLFAPPAEQVGLGGWPVIPPSQQLRQVYSQLAEQNDQKSEINGKRQALKTSKYY